MIETPVNIVASLALEGKSWMVVREIKDGDDAGNLSVTFYDWFPPKEMISEVAERYKNKVSDEKWRNQQVSKINRNRWNHFYMSEVARQTGILEQRIYTKEAFAEIVEQRKMGQLIEEASEDLSKAVTKWTMREQDAHKEELELLVRKMENKSSRMPASLTGKK